MTHIPCRPDVDVTAATELAREHFGVRATASFLPGERDRNFLLEAADGQRRVLKVASPDDGDEIVALESDILAWLGSRSERPPVPRIVPTRDGRLVARTGGPSGEPWRVRMLEYLPGTVLARARPRSDSLLEDVGARLGSLDVLLARYPGSVPDRPGFDWALERAGDVMARGITLITDPACRTLLERATAGFLGAIDGAAALPVQLIHGDVNDHNVLVSGPLDAPRHVTGLLDFGDAHRAPAVFDLAVALAYIMLDMPDPVGAAALVVAGYHRARPLEEQEVDLLLPLARARLGASVSISARRRASGETDPYLRVSEAPAWETLDALERIHDHVATGRLREACGYTASAREPILASWMEGVAVRPALGRVPEPEELMVLDLSVGSPLLTGRDTDDTRAFSRRVFGAMDEAGARVGVGRYDEPRGFYLTEAFDAPGAEMPERRTVHLGVDLFVEAGTDVCAPLPGRVMSVRDNAQRLDYGPTVILEHDGPDGPFWTLYGHLERASVRDLEAGTVVPAGSVIARVGPYPENGDWPPHLHFQILTDLLDRDGEFPGVAVPRERSVWCSLCPDPNLLLRLPVDVRFRDAEALATRRARVLGPSLSVSYDEPIHVVRGRGAHLFDALGRAYLDCVNNVAHVGHEHPQVVRAGERQMAVLNTNTRYLHELVIAYAERLGALFPEPLRVCFFVNSGSEANELALRMAHVRTGGSGVVALEGAYHGHTGRLVDLSHYKFAGPGGEGAPPWVRAVPLPDVYRGRHRPGDGDPAARYAEHVRDALAELEAAGRHPSAFLCESLPSCGGQIELPAGYLEQAYAYAREAGAVCIADEVQVGFGRVGTHFWGFETQGVVPDIVTLGKPMGNGHPIGAVVTTLRIAEAFANGMEFFSTFGGNPVSAAIGSAVLDVLEREGLQEHAGRVGASLRAALSGLAERHAASGSFSVWSSCSIGMRGRPRRRWPATSSSG
jgi:4-aminobutyrate aminotransferase-like enzyme/Ser/Thr protein kinase RdoA (MazF antagonist)